MFRYRCIAIGLFVNRTRNSIFLTDFRVEHDRCDDYWIADRTRTVSLVRFGPDKVVVISVRHLYHDAVTSSRLLVLGFEKFGYVFNRPRRKNDSE